MACTSQKIATWQSHDPAISCVQILEGMCECGSSAIVSYFVQYFNNGKCCKGVVQEM